MVGGSWLLCAATGSLRSEKGTRRNRLFPPPTDRPRFDAMPPPDPGSSGPYRHCASRRRAVQLARLFHVIVEGNRIEVETIRPSENAVIDENAGEEGWITQWLDHGSALGDQVGEIAFPLFAIGKANHQTIGAARFGTYDIDELVGKLGLIHRYPLPECVEGADALARAVPILHQLCPVSPRPFTHDARCARRQRSIDDTTCLNRNQRSIALIGSMEMWRRMLHKEHPNGDPEKDGDGRHGDSWRAQSAYSARQRRQDPRPAARALVEARE